MEEVGPNVRNLKKLFCAIVLNLGLAGEEGLSSSPISRCFCFLLSRCIHPTSMILVKCHKIYGKLF